MSRVLWISVTRQRCPGVRVSPGVAQRAFQSTPSSRTRPGSSAVTGVSTMASRPRLRSPLVAVGLSAALPPAAEGQQAQDAYHHEHHRLHPERLGEQAAQQGGGRADGKPDGGHIKGDGLQRQKAHGGSQPEKWGRWVMVLPPYAPIIGHPLGGRSRVFYWNVAQKTKYKQKWEKP